MREDLGRFRMEVATISSTHRSNLVRLVGFCNNRSYSLWAYEELEKGNVGAVLDRRLVEDEIDVEQAMRLLKVSFWCIQEHASFRPTMGKVVQMLEGIADVKKPPHLFRRPNWRLLRCWLLL